MANESIEGKAYNLSHILATNFGSYYQIPTYQRPYQWTEENCEKLLDDLFLIMKTTEKAIIFAAH
ncbi:hypothetical protein HpBGD112_05080 [Helicobacter pylori]